MKSLKIAFDIFMLGFAAFVLLGQFSRTSSVAIRIVDIGLLLVAIVIFAGAVYYELRVQR